MTAYTIVQCSICQRKKTVLSDNKRASLDLCTITKGCAGHLFKIGTSASRMITPAVEGLKDWSAPSLTSAESGTVNLEAPQTSLVTSSGGALTLALYQPSAVTTSNPSVIVRTSQLKSENISSQQYFFKPISSTTIISGKDTTGKVLRFDDAAIAQGRIFIRVNGVAKFAGQDLTLTPNTVNFNTTVAAGSSIDISVYQQAATVTRDLVFTSNASRLNSEDVGSWGNVAWIQERAPNGSVLPNKWWLYTCVQMSSIPSSAVLKLDKIYQDDGSTVHIDPAVSATSRWLVSSPPYGSVDRYLNFYIDSTVMAADYLTSFIVNSGNTELAVDGEALKEIYPPFQLLNSAMPGAGSFTSQDVYVSSAALGQDTTAHRLIGKKIIGPV